MTLLVTGGAGFIGSNLVLDWLARSSESIINLDALTYAGNRGNLDSLATHAGHVFVHGDIRDRALLQQLFTSHRPRAVVHLAAQTHVDRSITSPDAFIQTNVVGTGILLEAATDYWRTLSPETQADFRFLHVSTDEVYGSLTPAEAPCSETRRYQPSNPYSASKAASDHLVDAWHRTYGLPTLISHSANNLGPRQYPEKLIPLCISRALAGQPLPLYGDGEQRRDWLHVSDHCSALQHILDQGKPGEHYNVGSGNELSNLSLVEQLCDLLDEMRPHTRGSYRKQITFVADRPGHDRRYALDTQRLRQELGWQPQYTFATGLRATVAWYLQNSNWNAAMTSAGFHDWQRQQSRPEA